jgi:diguanylate cyclase (GGDEF)-like protein
MTNATENRIPLDDLLVFHQVARSLTSSFDLDAILRTIIEHMERFVDADLWTLLMLDETRQELYYAIAAGGEEASLRGLRVKMGEGVAGWVAEHGETLIVPEVERSAPGKEKRGIRNGLGKLGLIKPGFESSEIGNSASLKPNSVRSVIALPLCGRKGTQGVIEIFNPRAEQMSDYTIAFLHILADHAAIAIENAHDMARIQQLTITDDVTGLYNTRHLYEVLGCELERSKLLGLPLSLAFLDLDHFKLVNDAHGHLVGSELLALTGERLQKLSRKQDWCFRYGGDEFVILMPEIDAEEALLQTSALLGALMETEFQLKNGLKLRLSASVGLSTAPLDGATVHAIIGAADSRMYAVKSQGRGAVRGA